MAFSALFSYGQGPSVTGPEGVKWAHIADRYARPDTPERVRADVALAGIGQYDRRHAEGIRYYTRALELAERLGDSATYRYAALRWAVGVWSPRHAQKQLALAEEIMVLPREAGDPSGLDRETGDLSGLDQVLLAHGKRERAEEIWNEGRSLAEHSGLKWRVIEVMAMDCLREILDGRLEEALDIADEMEIQGRDSNLYEYAAIEISCVRARPEFYLGRPLKRPADFDDRVICSPVESLSAYADRDFDVPRRIRGFHKYRDDFTDSELIGPSWLGILYLEGAIQLGHRGATELLYRLLNDCGIVTTSIYLTTSTGRVLGTAAAYLDRPDEAREHYRGAIGAMTDMRFRPELALARFQMAELLLEHYPDDRSEALEHLGFALEEFRQMGMRPYIEKAQTLGEDPGIC